MKVQVLTIALFIGPGAGLRAQEQGMRTFSARVVDRTDKEPVPFANVQLEGSALSTLSDVKGGFSLEFPVDPKDGKSFLSITQLGYRPMRIRVRGSDKARLRRIQLRRIKFDLRSFQ